MTYRAYRGHPIPTLANPATAEDQARYRKQERDEYEDVPPPPRGSGQPREKDPITGIPLRCVHGHEMANFPENVYTCPKGIHSCRTCRRASQHRNNVRNQRRSNLL